jgi:hypothetical protein
MATSKYHRLSFCDVATWATAAPTNGSTWQNAFPIDPAEPDIVQEFDDANETSIDGMASARWPTVKSGKVSLTARAYTGSEGNGNSEAANTHFHADLMASYFQMATPTAGTGTTVSSGGPGNSVAVVVGSASNINVGDMLIFAAAGAAAATAEMAVVTAKSGISLTLDRDLSTAANYAASALVFQGFDYHPTLGNYAHTLYFNHELDGHSWMLGPGKINGFKINGITSRQGLRYQFDYAAASWAAGVTPSSTPLALFVANKPLVAVGSPAWINGTQTVISEMTVDFGAKIENVLATSDATGIGGMEHTETMPSGEITTYYASGRFTEWQAGTQIPLLLWVNNGATDAAKARASIGIYVPNASIDVKEASVNGQRGLKLSWQGRRPTVAQTTAGLTSPIYFTVFGGESP